MNDSEINDIRKSNEFKGITFSKFKKSDAKKELLKALIQGKVEPACYWSAEFICAGHLVEIWNIILNFMSNNIHLGNPKLPIYIEIRFNAFKNIVLNGYVGNEIRMRNNSKIRILFSEIITLLCLSKKKNSFDTIRVSMNDFNLSNMNEKLQADNVSYAKDVFMSNDPQEFFIALNELAYHLSNKSKNIRLSCYWIEWIIEFDRICAAKKKKCTSVRRSFIPVESKFQMDTIWMVWELFIREADKQGESIKKIIQSLLVLFCIRFTSPSKKKKKNILYFAASLLTEYVDFTIPLYSNNSIIEKVKTKINIIYKQVKKNEQSPKTSYLFNNSFTGHTLEKTIQKLEQMSQLTNILPRNK